MPHYLGVDGGGTGCRVAVADETGRILGRGHAGPANVNTDVAGTRSNIMAAVDQALDGTGISAPDLTAVLGLAGAGMPGPVAELARNLPFRSCRIVNDAVTATTGALQGEDGIVAILGTGSVFTRQQRGAFAQFGGHGFLLGDEGSGAVLGRRLLSAALRAHDGYAPLTPLLTTILREMGGPEGIIAFGGQSRPVDFGAFAPQILGSDDPAAIEVRATALAEVRSLIQAIQPQPALPVVFLGGLGPFYAAALQSDWPQRAARGSAVDGALWLARTGAD